VAALPAAFTLYAAAAALTRLALLAFSTPLKRLPPSLRAVAFASDLGRRTQWRLRWLGDSRA